jgi:hypothetical protein
MGVPPSLKLAYGSAQGIFPCRYAAFLAGQNSPRSGVAPHNREQRET